jgi:hypothetical protein
MMGYSGMSTTIKKWVEMKMKMTINLYGKGNEVVFLCMFYKWSCFFLIVVVNTCNVMDNAWCTISKWVGSTMTMFVKVWNSFMMIRISTWCQMWQRERWETSLCMCVSLFKAIVARTFQKVLWAIMCSLLHKHWSKLIL